MRLGAEGTSKGRLGLSGMQVAGPWLGLEPHSHEPRDTNSSTTTFSQVLGVILRCHMLVSFFLA